MVCGTALRCGGGRARAAVATAASFHLHLDLMLWSVGCLCLCPLAIGGAVPRNHKQDLARTTTAEHAVPKAPG